MIKLSLASVQSDPYGALFFGSDGKTHHALIAFYGIALGFFVAIYLQTGIALLLWVTFLFAAGICTCALSVSDNFAGMRTTSVQYSQPVVVKSYTAKSCGVVYVLKRNDGILKIGRTRNLRNRIQAHNADYGATFDPVTAWVVPDAESYEHQALGLTSRYAYCEGNRRELRRMSESELSQFILDFTDGVYRGFKKTA